MTKIIAEITDIGDMVILDPIDTPREDFETGWDWLQRKKLIEPELTPDGRIDHNWIVGVINTEYNNDTIRKFVWGRFMEEYGEEVLE